MITPAVTLIIFDITFSYKGCMPGAPWRQTIKRLGKRTSYSKQIGLLEPFYLNAIFLLKLAELVHNVIRMFIKEEGQLLWRHHCFVNIKIKYESTKELFIRCFYTVSDHN